MEFDHCQHDESRIVERAPTDLLYEVFGEIDMTQTFVAVDHEQRRDELKDNPSDSGF
jgi:hypothetical protein